MGEAMEQMRVECKVGIFVFIGVVILSVLVFKIGGIDIFSADMYTVYAVFDSVSGVNKESPVHVAGVNVGEVKKLDIFYNPVAQKMQVKLALRIRKSVRIPRDSRISVKMLGVLGDKYLEVESGVDVEHPVRHGDSLPGQSPVQMEKIADALSAVVGNKGVQDSLRDTIYNLKETTDHLRDASASLQEILARVERGEGTLGRFLEDDSIYVVTQSMIENLSVKLDKTVVDLNSGVNELVDDFKKHPWKLLQKPPREKKKKTDR
ncbi:MAG: MlaD family protein [Candidatus Omnitrophica bacterium]|nr:MlaD family protein [Candidatus Omnitrophota bacterium]